MSRVLSEDAVRRAFAEEEAGPLENWQREHLWRSVEPVLKAPWICDIDVTVKTIYGGRRSRGGLQSAQARTAGARVSHLFHFAVAAGFGCGGGAGQTISQPGRQPKVLGVVGEVVGPTPAYLLRGIAVLATRTSWWNARDSIASSAICFDCA